MLYISVGDFILKRRGRGELYSWSIEKFRTFQRDKQLIHDMSQDTSILKENSGTTLNLKGSVFKIYLTGLASRYSTSSLVHDVSYWYYPNLLLSFNQRFNKHAERANYLSTF